MRGPTLGVALAYAWVAYPFTLFALESNSNDSFVGALVLAAVLAASYRSQLAHAGRGALAVLAGLTKFAPLALAPLLATHGLERALARAPRTRAGAVRGSRSLGTPRSSSIPALSHDSLHTIYERTIVYQSNRGSPFSVWGLYGLQGLETVVEIAAVALAVALAVLPRRADIVGLAAACAAVDHRHAAGDRTLVLPVHPLVLRARDRRPVRSAQRSVDAVAGRGISTCSNRVGPQRR